MKKSRRIATLIAAAGLVVALAVWLRAWRPRSDRRDLPAGVGFRRARIVGLGSRVARTTATNRVRRALAPPERKQALESELQLQTANDVVATLGEMKGAVMKLGQMAGYVYDGMPESVRQTFAQLQQDAPPMSSELAESVVEAELGAAPKEVFDEWDRVPFAAASLGQVHRATTRDGRLVAVKVQYPGVDEAMHADLANLDLARHVLPFLWRQVDAEAVTTELRARLMEELDYEHEASNQRMFAEMYDGHPFIQIPAVVDEYCSKRVLTAELATGARFADMESWDQTERDLAGEVIFRFIFRSLHRFHVFNGDPHPGNYVFRPGGRVAFLDFGLVRRFEAEQIERVAAPLLARLRGADPHTLRTVEERTGWFLPGAPISDEQAVKYSNLFWEHFLEDREFTFTREHAAAFVRRYLFDRGEFGDVLPWILVPPEFVVLQRINAGLISILGRLDATAHWRGILEEILPDIDGPPATPLGAEEASWSANRPVTAPTTAAASADGRGVVAFEPPR